MKTALLSILIPVYNERDCIGILYERLNDMAEKLHCEVEFLFVNDGSSDDSLAVIRRLREKDTRISYVDLSRNFGKEVALCAGIDYIRGDALVIIDADLQHPPELIPVMLEELEKGYDDVYAYRSDRKSDTWLKKWTAKGYYATLRYLSNIPVQENAGDFRMFDQKAINALRELKERERNMKGLFSFIGFNKKPVRYDHGHRLAGKTKWNYFFTCYINKTPLAFEFYPSQFVGKSSGSIKYKRNYLLPCFTYKSPFTAEFYRSQSVGKVFDSTK